MTETQNNAGSNNTMPMERYFVHDDDLPIPVLIKFVGPYPYKINGKTKTWEKAEHYSNLYWQGSMDWSEVSKETADEVLKEIMDF